MITATCSISGKTFAVPFLDATSTFRTSEEEKILHPVFHLPTKTLLHISAKGCPPIDNPRARDSAGLLLLAIWHRTGLVTFSCPVFPTLRELTFYFDGARKTLESVANTNVRVSKIPKFHVTPENRDNFFGGYLKTLDSYRDLLAAQEVATALASEVNALDRTTIRREMYGFKTIPPAIAARVANLIEWEGPDAEIVISFLTATPAQIVAQINSEEIFLPDLSALLLDVELLDWQGPTKALVLDHLRGIVNTIHTLRGLSNEEKELFTDVVEKAGGILDVFDEEPGIALVDADEIATPTPSQSWATKLAAASTAPLPKTSGTVRLPLIQTTGRATLAEIFAKRGIVK